MVENRQPSRVECRESVSKYARSIGSGTILTPDTITNAQTVLAMNGEADEREKRSAETKLGFYSRMHEADLRLLKEGYGIRIDVVGNQEIFDLEAHQARSHS